MASKRFKARIIQDDGSSACGIKLPFHPKDAFGKVRAPVRATLNGHTFRTTICSMGGSYWIPLNRANREAAGVSPGESVAVSLDRDDAPRVVKPPADFARALRAAPTADAAWKKLSYTHQREHVEAIEAAKQPETRQRRIAKAVEALSRE